MKKVTLTKDGKRNVRLFIRECEIKRKEILDVGLDTAEDTCIPTIDDIISDIEVFMDENGDYYNSWGVTDNYNSDNPLCLSQGEDFIFMEDNIGCLADADYDGGIVYHVKCTI